MNAMRQLIMAALLTAACLPRAVIADDWVVIAKTDEGVFEVRAGSVQRGVTNVTKEPVIYFIVRERYAKIDKTIFEKEYVKLSDCEAGYGKAVVTELDGTYRNSYDFVFSGGTVSSSIAETLCALATRTST